MDHLTQCELIKVLEDMKSLGAFVEFTSLTYEGEGQGESQLDKYVEDAVRGLASSTTLERLKDNPVVRAFRNFYWRLGIDPTKVRPSSEALARRALRGEFPRVSPLVDAGNIASVLTLIPIGIYDLDLLSPPLIITLSKGSSKFTPIGGREEALPPGYPVMVDQRGVVVHVYAHRDSTLTSVRASTRRALVVGTGVPGVEKELVRKAVRTTAELAARVGWRQQGDICEA
ncbi:MAG: B3/B4 domain-containing protein [Acidilobus sp.]